jgi:Holliday junction DNA helicase RuvA
MIFSIQGLIEQQNEDSVVLSLAGLVSLHVLTPRANQLIPGNHVKLFTHLQVREDSFVLFGFMDEEELFWFRTLLSIPGIGAKTALNLLSSFPLSELLTIIQEDKPQLLTKASGVGAATAKKIVLFMSEKLKKKLFQPVKKECPFPDAFEEAKHILMDLGLTQKEATDLLSEIKKEDETLCEEPQTLVKEALKRRSH